MAKTLEDMYETFKTQETPLTKDQYMEALDLMEERAKKVQKMLDEELAK